jgi:hypothetical protein
VFWQTIPMRNTTPLKVLVSGVTRNAYFNRNIYVHNGSETTSDSLPIKANDGNLANTVTVAII